MTPLFKPNYLLVLSVFYLSGCAPLYSVDKKPVNHKSHTNKCLQSICTDQTKQYQIVNHLTTITSLNSKAQAYSPIIATQGIIEKDINHDKQKDLIFIETQKSKQGKKARLVLCLSSGKRYIRKYPDFPIHINTQPDFQTSQQRIEWKNQRLVLSRFKSEHNWGSDDEVKQYRYDNNRKQFILVSHELTSSSGDGLRSNTYELYDFDKRTYKNQNQCGHLEEGCKNTKTHGQLILPKQRASLFQPNKPFLSKVPQQ